mgnify:CR=1 FL=1
MEPEVPNHVFLIIAMLTPVIAFVGWLVVGHGASGNNEVSSKKIHRNLILLALAGPVNLLLWYVVNGWLKGVGSRSVIGYVLAAMVFLVAGYATGFFGRLRRGRRSGND